MGVRKHYNAGLQRAAPTRPVKMVLRLDTKHSSATCGKADNVVHDGREAQRLRERVVGSDLSRRTCKTAAPDGSRRAGAYDQEQQGVRTLGQRARQPQGVERYSYCTLASTE